jgi:NAD(P)-dependent dehydrogenase (short-subunit alcohol dehydrogenase family)
VHRRRRERAGADIGGPAGGAVTSGSIAAAMTTTADAVSDPSAGSRPRVVVVTGGAKGIGWATVRAFATTGAIPVLLDRDEHALAAAHEVLNGEGVEHVVRCVDITDETAVEAAFQEVVTRCGRLDVLVNNAGIALRRPTVELPRADWQAVVDVNLTAVFLCCRAAARTMIAAGGGAIVNVSSIMGLSGGGLYPNVSYQSTKGALVNMTRALAVEWAAHGIRVNAVAPTWVRTELTQGLFGNPELLARILDMTPMRCLAEPADIADAIVFLASGKARMITGHTLPVDGGFLAQ